MNNPNQKSNQIGDHNPIVGGFSTQYNNEPGVGAMNPMGKGTVDPGRTKPMNPKPSGKAPLNAGK